MGKIVHKDEDVISLIFQHHNSGFSIRTIAKLVDVPKSTVHRILNGKRSCDKWGK